MRQKRIPDELPDSTPQDMKLRYKQVVEELERRCSPEEIEELVKKHDDDAQQAVLSVVKQGITPPPLPQDRLVLELFQLQDEAKYFWWCEREQQQRRSHGRPKLTSLDKAIIVACARLRKQGKKPSAKMVEKELETLIGKGVVDRISARFIFWHPYPYDPRKQQIVRKLCRSSLPSKISRLIGKLRRGR